MEKKLNTINKMHKEEVEALTKKSEDELNLIIETHEKDIQAMNSNYGTTLSNIISSNVHMIRSLKNKLNNVKQMSKEEKKLYFEKALFRSFSVRSFFRSLMAFGVISTNSVSSINEMYCSKLN